MSYDRNLDAAVAVTRLGLGARPGEIADVRSDPRGWLEAQIRPAGADQPRSNPPSAAQRVSEFRAYQQQKQAAKTEGDAKSDPVRIAGRMLRDDAGADFLARARLATATDAGFRERWALFWTNHFTVSANKLVTATLVGPFEQEAIRPRVFGRFADLLVAASSHPAMLIYLDQAASIGPNSSAAAFLTRGGRQGGLNENLAREIMELHTVGLEGGYSQADVTEFARALTGWSVGGLKEDPARTGRFYFRAAAHEPGARTVMGRRYGDDGQGQALAVLKDLAASPVTARRLSLKIARHFVADDPPPGLAAGLARAWMRSGGDLGAVARALVAAPQALLGDQAKFKTPYEFLVSSWRATGESPSDIASLAPILTAMGQKPFAPPSPKGWPEEAAVWCDPDAVIKRMAWSSKLAASLPSDREPDDLALAALGARLSSATVKAMSRAETRPEAVAILLMSPEFQRR